MNTKLLRYILSIAEEGSFSNAAKNLYVSQSSLSQTISRYEKDLGTPIFNRKTYPLTLTNAGEEYIKAAKNILNIENSLIQKINEIKCNNVGHLCIGISLFRNSTIMPSIIENFYRKFPKVKISMIEAINKQLIEMVYTGKIDIAFVNSKHINGLKCIKILTDRVLLAVGNKYPIKQYPFSNDMFPKINLNLLRDEKFALTSPGTNLRKVTDQIFKEYRMTPYVAVETSSLQALHSLVLKNFAISFTLESFLSLYPINPHIKYFLFHLKDYKVDLYICYRENRQLDTIIKYFLGITKQTVVNLSQPTVITFEK